MNTKNLEKNGYYDNIEKYLKNVDIKKMNECPCDAGYVDIDKKKFLDEKKILNNKQNSSFSLEVFNEYLKNFSSINKKSKKNHKKSKKNITKKRHSELNNTNNDNFNDKIENKNTKFKKKNIIIMLCIVLFYLKFVKNS